MARLTGCHYTGEELLNWSLSPKIKQECKSYHLTFLSVIISISCSAFSNEWICSDHILFLSFRGPFVTAMGKSWCPDHFICANPRCGNKLVDIGFVEEGGFLYCEKDYELYFAPKCAKCDSAIVGVCI